jgi:hypothetical protein
MNLIASTDVILCGMPSEYDVLGAAFPNNAVLTGTAKENLMGQVPPTCTRVISMGLAGGLFASLKIADVVLATTVVDNIGNRWYCDPKWNDAVMQMGSYVVPQSPGPTDPVPVMWNKNLTSVPWFSSGAMDLADTGGQRAAIYKATKALAIDDETYSVAVFCKENGIPFNVCRSISDDASETLPLAARGSIMNADGSVDIAYLIQELQKESILRTLDLVTIAADYFASLDTLQAAATALSR